jgi:hypothetical protein
MTRDEAHAIGIEAYIYFYPLLSMDITRRVLTNSEPGTVVGHGPANTFVHVRAYPAADFREVVRPNFDTLYSSAWLDLGQEPLIVSVPDTQGRYYLLPMLDMWTDVFAAPGWRTSGTKAGHFAVLPPGWTGELPAGVEPIQAPTPIVWIIGRTQTNGPSDYAFVNGLQDGFQITPLSRWGQGPGPVAFQFDPSVDMHTEPLRQVNALSAAAYFAYAAELLQLHPPHLADWSTIARLKRIGIERGKPFVFQQLAPEVRAALETVPADALAKMQAAVAHLGRVTNGWVMVTDSIGTYGNFYLKRADITKVGLGANQPEDAIYPLNVGDADGQPLNGDHAYVLHFEQHELPPVDAFWSVTMYDAEGFQAANSLDRFAIGDRDPLVYNPDGSLDLYLQHDSPGADKEANWLPAPRGPLGVTMRLYAPKPAALDGTWNPPVIKKVG